MAGYNRVVLVGNLTRDPEHRQLASGQGVCRLGLAMNRQFKNRNSGDLVQEVCYVDIDVWGAQAESCNQYLAKGRSVLIEGRLKFDSWEDQNGQTRSKHSVVADRVVFLSSAAAEQDGMTRAPQAGGSFTSAAQTEQPSVQSLQNEINKVTAAEPAPEATRKQRKAKPKDQAAEQADSKAKSPSGELDFKDQPPFEDDLPF